MDGAACDWPNAGTPVSHTPINERAPMKNARRIQPPSAAGPGGRGASGHACTFRATSLSRRTAHGGRPPKPLLQPVRAALENRPHTAARGEARGPDDWNADG